MIYNIEVSPGGEGGGLNIGKRGPLDKGTILLACIFMV